MNAWRLVFGLCSLFCALSASAAEPELKAAIEKRLVRLKRTEAAHQELFAERAKVQAQWKGVAEQLTMAQQQIVILNQQSNTLANNFAALQLQHANLVSGGGSPTQIQLVRTQINLADANVKQVNMAITQAKLRSAALGNEAGGHEQVLRGVQKQIDKQLVDYLEFCDPFGTLSRAEHEATLPELNAWIKADAENWGARMVRAMANRKLEKEVEALTDIEAIVESESGLAPLALAARGELKIARAEEARGNDKQNLEKQGLADLAQAYKIDKKSPYIFLMRGLANCRMNKFAAAEADFKSALRADKTCYEANRLLTLLHAASEIPGLRDGRQALEYGKKAAEISKYSDWACLDALAAAHAEAGEYDEAARTAHEASELAFGENRDLCLERAKLYESRMPLRIKWSKNRA